MVHRRAAVCAALVALAATASPRLAAAQPTVDRRYQDEPTSGVYLPATPMAGEQDARAVSVNPSGLQFLRGPHLTLALDLSDEDVATSGGSGFAAFLASSLFGGLLPKVSYGVGLEVLAPPRARLIPDPGSPVRFTYAQSIGLGRAASFGVAWHHFFDDSALGGLDTFDVGLSMRLGNWLAAGAVVRDVGAPDVGATEVQRRYELELTGRPFGTDRLDLGLGGRVGEVDANPDGWLRASLKVARGVYLHAVGESRALRAVEAVGADTRTFHERDLRVSAGLEVSFGAIGVAAFGSGILDDQRHRHLGGGTLIARLSAEEVPAVQGRPDRIERIDLTSAVDPRELTDIVVKLRAIERDPAAKAVVVAIDGVDAGWGTLEEIRNGLLRVRAAGKKVFAYMVAGTGRDYWVATAADKIYVDPAGGVRLAGFAGTTLYYKGAFDKLGVQAQFEKIAEYKSAPEAYTATGPSEPALRMRNELYDSLWGDFVDGIAQGRHLDRATVEALIDAGPFTSGDLARDRRLVDAVADPDQVAELIAKELGTLYPIEDAPDERPAQWSPAAVAVIYIDGDIIDGKSMTIPFLGRHLVGGETIAEAIAAARADPDVGAIILRIDSPGGSALASELMAREVFKTRGVKPIVCSMGDLAASGGYFVAAGCDTIFADRMTITGSIGIFYGKFDFSGLLGKLGITAETFRRGRRADMESFFRPYTDEERAHLRERIRYFYGRFVAAVAEGRGMSETAVDAVGRGRVWSGVQGKQQKLVDRFGGLVDTLAYAKQQMGVGADEPVRLIQLPSPAVGFLNLLLGDFMKAQAPALSLRDLPGGAAIADAIPGSVWAQPDSPQARLPFNVVWQ